MREKEEGRGKNGQRLIEDRVGKSFH